MPADIPDLNAYLDAVLDQHSGMCDVLHGSIRNNLISTQVWEQDVVGSEARWVATWQVHHHVICGHGVTEAGAVDDLLAKLFPPSARSGINHQHSAIPEFRAAICEAGVRR